MLETLPSSLSRVDWQGVVFSDRPPRRGLRELCSAGLPVTPLRIHVHRNQPFEFIASCAEAFLRYAGWQAAFTYSDYDDSLSFERREPADVELLWLDFGRYAKPELGAWLEQRVRRLRGLTDAPILIAGGAISLPGIYACDLSAIERDFGEEYFDSRLAELAAMRLSAPACVEIARHLAFLWLPPALGPRLKAVAVDLDNTLYSGVLAEDGPDGVTLSHAHLELQRALVRLQESGILLAAVSRNEAADAEDLFAARADFPLSRDRFSAWSVSWNAKSQSLREVAAELRIGPESILFLDDNAGELAEAAGAIPGLHVLYAADPAETMRALNLYPGLHGYPPGGADSLRAADLAAARQRNGEADAAGDPDAYLASLGLELSFALNPASDAARLRELSAKTNQFNTGFLRLTDAEIARRLAAPEYRTVSVRLRDRLSDSGAIGAIFARAGGDALHIEDICVSCRALGRRIEDVMVTECLKTLAGGADTDVVFRFVEGPRNAPAREWLARYTGMPVTPAGGVRVPLQSLVERTAPLPVSLTWHNTWRNP